MPEKEPKEPTIPRFQVEKVRVHGHRSDGSQYIRETYRVFVNVGIGRIKADRIAAILNQLRLPSRRRELAQLLALQQVVASSPSPERPE